MARDEREEEQEFLADLKARTGRSLADWMAAITAQGFADKNETIDWLRGKGFPFARASWLERIHSNGGRPIYEGALARRPEAEASAAPAEKPAPTRPAQKPLSLDTRPCTRSCLPPARATAHCTCCWKRNCAGHSPV